MKKIYAALFCLVLLTSLASAGQISSFWLDQGLSKLEADSIENDSASIETIAKAELLQQKEPITNKSLMLLEQEEIKKFRWGVFFMSVLGLMALGGILFLVKAFFGGGRV